MALKPGIHGRDHCPGGADPIPCLGSIVEVFAATSVTDLGTSLTTLDFATEGFDTATSITVNGASNIQIAGIGVYSFEVYSSAWTLNAAVTSTAFYTVNVISGSTGNWTSRTGANEITAEVPLRVNDLADTIDFSPFFAPDLHGTAAWKTADTFPIEIEIKAVKFQNGAGTADATVAIRVGVVRLGDAFE